MRARSVECYSADFQIPDRYGPEKVFGCDAERLVTNVPEFQSVGHAECQGRIWRQHTEFDQRDPDILRRAPIDVGDFILADRRRAIRKHVQPASVAGAKNQCCRT